MDGGVRQCRAGAWSVSRVWLTRRRAQTGPGVTHETGGPPTRLSPEICARTPMALQFHRPDRGNACQPKGVATWLSRKSPARAVPRWLVRRAEQPGARVSRRGAARAGSGAAGGGCRRGGGRRFVAGPLGAGGPRARRVVTSVTMIPGWASTES